MIRQSITTLLLAAVTFAQQDPGTGVIEGRVLHSISGAPVRRSFVRLICPTPAPSLTAATDSEGNFEFNGLPPGSYRLRAERQGFENRSLPFSIQLAQDQRSAGIEIRLRPLASISGRVTDEDGEPVIRARVMIFKQTWRHGRRNWEQVDPVVETDEQGGYRVANVAPGRYLVQSFDPSPPLTNRFGGAPASYAVPTYHPNAVSREQATAVSLRSGTEASGIDIRAARVPRRTPVRVQGRVTGAPAGSAIGVTFNRTDESPMGGGGTVARPPDYTFDHTVQPGTYSISANVYSGDAKAFGSLPIAVTGDLSGVVIALSQAPFLSGLVTTAEEGAQPNTRRMTVSLERPSHAPWEARVDASGKFTMPDQIPQGRYSIAVNWVPSGFFVKSIRLGESEIAWDDFEIASSVPLRITLSRAGGTIEGTVTTRDGKLAPEVAVTLIPSESGGRPEKSMTNGGGVFRFEGVRPGKYLLFAWEKADDDLWPDPEFRSPYRSKAVEVTVEAGANNSVTLRLIELDE